VKDAFQQFAPDGFATIVDDQHGRGGRSPDRQVWKGMPILELLNDACNTKDSGGLAAVMANAIKGRGNPLPGFYLFRTVWVSPATITDALATLRRQHPNLNVEMVSPHTFFALFKASLERPGKAARP
jgi:hypothetical protein